MGDENPPEFGAGVIGVIGLGNMGLPMAARLRQAGYDVHGYDRDVAASSAAQRTGIATTASVADLARTATTIIMLLPGSHVVDPVAAEISRVPADDRTCDFIIDMSSSSPGRTRSLGAELAEHGITLMDAPVSGGVTGAREGTLTIMVGGGEGALHRARPVLEHLGTRLIHIGDTGTGHAAKALNNLLSATHLMATNEALIVGARFGIDPEVLNSAINVSSGRSGSTENKMPRFILSGTFDSGFSSALLAKDIGIATTLAQEIGIDAPIGRAVQEWWLHLAAQIPPDADHTEIIRPLETESGVQVRARASVLAEKTG